MLRKIVFGFLIIGIGIGFRVPVEVSAVEVSTVEVPVNVITDNFEDVEFTQSKWDYLGNASNPVADVAESNNEVMQLTGSTTSQAGSIWLKQNVSPPFDVTLRYRMLDSSYIGADGLVFMFNKLSNTGLNSYKGGDMGFVQGNGYGVEFDTYDNGSVDEYSNSHISLFYNTPSNVSNTLELIPQQGIESESWKYVRIEVRPTSVNVYWGDSPTLGGMPILSWLGSLDMSNSGVGFTASTGAEWSKHQIDDVSITRYEEVVEEDTTPPVLTLLGANPLFLIQGTPYEEPGYTVTDADPNVSVTVTGSVYHDVPGDYSIVYSASDTSGNTSSITRTVTVATLDNEAPVITLNGDNFITIEQGSNFVDPGAAVTDNLSEVLEVVSSGTVDTSNPGTYTITYNATDAAGNHAITKERTVEVVQGQAPVINLNGDEFVIVEQGSDYSDPGATVFDNVDQNLLVVVNGLIELNSKLDQGGSGKYTITYNATDQSGRMAEEVTRTVVVIDRDQLIEIIAEHEEVKLDISNIFQFISHNSGLFGDYNLHAEEIRYLLYLIEPIYSRVADH